MAKVSKYLAVLVFFLCLQSGFAVGQTITEIIDATGDGAGKTLSGARGLAVDSSGNVYVAAHNSDNAFKITPGGVITEIINSTGDGAGNSLDGPTGVAVDAIGNVYVTGLNSNNAFKITPSGVITEIIDAAGDGSGNLLSAVWGIAVDSSGTAYVTGSGSNNAFKITSAGVITEIIDSTGDGAGNTFRNPYGITVDSSANVYVVGYSYSNVFKITPSGVISEIIDATGDGTGKVFSRPFGVAVDSSSNVYVVGASSDNAFKITPSGVITEIIDSTGDGAGNAFRGPYAVTADVSGNIYVSSSADSRNAFKITSAGVITKFIDSAGDGAGNGLQGPLFVVSDASGNVYLSGQVSNNVFKVTFPLPAPTISSAMYNANSGALAVTATNLLSLAGAANDIDASKLTLTGEGGSTYTLTDSADVEISSATAFTVTLSATDKATLNRMLNKNGTSSTGGTTYNLAAADDFVAGVTAGDTADATNAVIVSNVAVPTITSATYDYGSGSLVITGTGLLNAAGAANDIDVSALTFRGQGGATYTLSNSADVDVSSGTSATVSIIGADLSAVNALLNKVGTSADDDITYNLAGAEDWNTGADPAMTIADAAATITVSNVPAPTISSATYNASTGALAVTATNLLSLAGATNDIDVSRLTLTGEGGATYTFNDSAGVEISSSTAFAVTLSVTDKTAVNRMLNKNGSNSTGGTTYNLASADDFVAGVTAGDTADATNSVTVSNVAVPTITSATYDYNTGSLVITGTGFLNAAGVSNDIDVSKLTFTGQSGATYTLSNSADVDVSNSTTATVLITGADLTSVNSLLNKSGTSADDGTMYNFAGAEDWNTGADAAVMIADSTATITVSNVPVPAISSASYNANTGALAVTATNLLSLAGAANDIDASKLTLTGEGGATYTLTDTADVEISSATVFTVTLSATDKATVNRMLNKNGSNSTGGTTYNLAAADDFVAGVTAGDTADATNVVTVSNVAIPKLVSATYDYNSGSLIITGTGFLNAAGASNDIDVSKLTVTGQGGTTYTLNNSADVDVSNDTTATVSIIGADLISVNALLNKTGAIADDGTTYNLAGAEDWNRGADLAFVIVDSTAAIFVSNVPAPAISSATYDSNAGALVVTGTNLLSLAGAANDIDASMLSLRGEGGAIHTLTDTADVDISSTTAFTVSLSATDKAAVNLMLNKNGNSSTGGTIYNLAAADDFVTGVTAGDTADVTNAITVSNVAVPTLISATYDYSSGALLITGTDFLNAAGASNDIDVSKLIFTGQGGASFTLISSADVDVSSDTGATVPISGADLAAVQGLLNKNGSSAADGTIYNLAGEEGWNTGADPAVTIADASAAIIVSDFANPAITSATYDVSARALLVTGTNFVANSAASNDIDASMLTLRGERANSYTLTDSTDVDISSATTFTVTLSATDALHVHGLLNKNGTSASDTTTYNLGAADNWMTGSPAANEIADITGNGITVTNTQIPSIGSAVYNADTGIFVVTGSNLFHKVGSSNDIDLSAITLTGGAANATYRLTTNSGVEVSSSSSFTFTLVDDDKTGAGALLDQLGTSSSGGSTYNLAVADNWLTAAESATDIADTTAAITVAINPKITLATYNASTGTLRVTGTNIQENGSANDIDASMFTLTGEGGVTYTLTDTADVERDSINKFTMTLSAADKAGVNAIATSNGSSSTGGTIYNLAAADDWTTNVTDGDTADITNTIAVSGVPVPTISSAAYDGDSGALVVTGMNLLALSGAANDIDASMLVFTGEGSATYALTDSANVDIASAAAFTINLSATDKAAVNLIINKNGTSSTGATVYNLAANEDWATGAEAAVNVVDATGNAITVSNVGVPTISGSTYNASSGALTVTGTGYLSLSGAANDIDASKLTFTGVAGGTYTLTNSDDAEISSGTEFSLTLSATDKAAVNQLLNSNGIVATDSTAYNLAAAEDWAAGADAAVSVADLTGNGITVSGIVVIVPEPAAPAPAKPVEPVNTDASPMIDSNGVEVQASIGGGIKSTSEQSFVFEDAAFSVGDAIELVVNIALDPSHLGQAAQIIVAVREARNPDFLLLMGSDGSLVPYDGVNLVPFEEQVLTEQFSVNLSKDSPIVLTSTEVGNFEVFVGYALADGTLVYNQNPITFEVIEQ